MKKLFLALMALLVATATFAKKDYEFMTFIPNEEGDIVIAMNVNTELDKKAVLRAIKRDIVSKDGAFEVVNEEEGRYTGYFTGTRYMNPFTGWTTRELHFDLRVVVENGVASITFSNLRIKDIFAGDPGSYSFGMHKENTYDVEERMETYFNNKRLINDASTPKKERKEMIDENNEIVKIFDGCDEEFAKRLDKLTRGLK